MSSKEKPHSFSLTSAGTIFSTRSNDVFGSLDALEKTHSAYQKTQESFESLEHAGIIKHDPTEEDIDKRQERKSSHSRHGPSTSHRGSHRQRPIRSGYRERDRNIPRDGFRRPRNLPFRSKKVPDFKKHPERWTSYSLEDVSENDLSERTNTRAALDFLWEKKNDREREERLAAGLPAEEEKFESEIAACSKGVISFSKKSKERKMESDDGNSDSTTCTRYNSVSDSYSNEDDDINSAFLLEMRKSQLSTKDRISELSMSNLGECSDDIEQQSKKEPTPTFKSRKNVKKQIRKRDTSLEPSEDSEG